MANTNLIYTYIQDSGYKLQYVASVLHISSTPCGTSCWARPSSSWTKPSGFPPCWG